MSEKLIKEIKQKKPTLQELKIILKKNKITSRDEIHELFIKHDLLKYIKKDKQFITMKKKASKKIDFIPFKCRFYHDKILYHYLPGHF